MAFHVFASGIPLVPNVSLGDMSFATLKAARDGLRRLRKEGHLTGPVRIEVHAGTHYLSEPLELFPEDSNVTFVGVAAQRPVISGGVPITGWRERSQGVWVAELPDLGSDSWVPRSLYVNNQRATLARSPNAGYYRTVGAAPPLVGSQVTERDLEKKAFRYKAGDLKNWPDLSGANLVVLFVWESALLPIRSVDEKTRTVYLAGNSQWRFSANQRYYVENALEAMDTPGEWYFDHVGRVLYYRPHTYEDMSTVEVVVPRLRQVVSFRGNPDSLHFVSNVRFEHLSFQHTNYPLEPEGHADSQAAATVDAAIQATGATQCGLVDCEVAHVGNYGVWFERGCVDNFVGGSYIHDGSAGGVRIGETTIPSGPRVTSGNTVNNCLIQDLGRDFFGAVPVWIGQSSENVISHNEISDANYSGISCGWTWGYGASAASHNLIEYNYIHDLGRGRLCDLGGIYTLGVQPGTTIRNNLIHDVWDRVQGCGAGGIYLDEGSSQILVENNVVFRTGSGGLTVHYGRDVVCRNNVYAFGRDFQLHMGRRDMGSSLVFEHNIVYFDQGQLFFPEKSAFVGDFNTYYQANGEDVVFPGNLTLSQWQAQGFDKHSVVGNPRFEDPGAYDFRLQADSPAIGSGAASIDLGECGITGAPTLARLARTVKRDAASGSWGTQDPPLSLDDSFEDTPDGSTADFATTAGETQASRVRVSSAQAATGKRSLRFSGPAGGGHPYIFYAPDMVSGVVTLRYALRFGSGAAIRNEWRDAATPYRVGPTIAIDAMGQLVVAGRKLLGLPSEQWIHFEVVCGVGEASDGTWTLRVVLPGNGTHVFRKLPCDTHFKELRWLGFVSGVAESAVVFLDDLTLSQASGLSP